MNILFLAPSFFHTDNVQGLVLVNRLASEVWGAIFLILGTGMIAALLMNNWRLIRTYLMIGLVTKSAFAWSLMIADIANFSTHGITGVWMSLMVIQALCIIYFTPEIRHGSH